MSQLIMHDKKKSGNDIYFVFIEGIGKAVVKKVPVERSMDFYRQNKQELILIIMNSFGVIFRVSIFWRIAWNCNRCGN